MKLKQNIFLVIFTILLLLGLTGCGKKTVVLDDYLEFSSEGYDTKGTATVSFDYRKFEDEYGKKIKFKKKDERRKFVKEYSLKSSVSDSKLLLATCVKLELDEDSNLSNGDTISVKFDCDDELAEEYFGVELSYSDVEYTVDNLKKVDKFNPFDYIKVTFSGTAPNGYINIEKDTNRKELEYIIFTADKTSGIQIGDKIKIKAECYINDDEFVEKFGSIIEETENEYKCDNLDHYIAKIDEISEETMNELIVQGDSIFKAHVASNWAKPENLGSVSYIGNYFLTLKPGMDSWYDNYLYLVYKVQATNVDPVQTVDYYYYVVFKDLKLLADGTYDIDINNYSTPNTNFYVGNYYYYGYQDLNSFISDNITANIDKYEYTTSITQ
jgi:hypothetical protein